MFHLFRRNNLFNKNIDPHCAYCAHCQQENDREGVCEFRGVVALAGNCRRFTYDALRRVPAKPARIRGRFTDDDFFFEERKPAPQEPEEEFVEPEPEIPASMDKPDSAEGDIASLKESETAMDEHSDKLSDAESDDAENEEEPPAEAPVEEDIEE